MQLKILFIVIFAAFCLPQSAYSQPENYTSQNFFIDEGLPVIRIMSISQDTNGLIWLCSKSQLHTFNGSQFDLQMDFDELNFSPNKIYIDNNGNKWLLEQYLSRTTKYKIDIINLKIIDSNNKELKVDEYLNLQGEKVEVVSQGPDGRMIFSTEAGFYNFNKTLKKISLPKETTNLVYSDSTLHIINNQYGSSILDIATNKTSNFLDTIKVNKVTKKKDLLYLHLTNGHLVSYDPKLKKTESISESILNYSLKPQDSAADFVVDASGNLIVVKLTSLNRFDLSQKKEFELIEEKNTDSDPYYTTIFIDREDNIWVGTNMGIYKLSKKKKTTFKTTYDFNFSTRKIYPVNKDKFFVSTYNGDFIYNLETAKYYNVPSDIVILDIIKDKGQFYTLNSRTTITKRSSLEKRPSLVNEVAPYDYREGKYPGKLIKTRSGKKCLVLYHKIYEFDDELNLTVLLEGDSKDVFFNHCYEVNNDFYILTNRGILIYDQNFNFKVRLFNNQNIKLLHQDKDQKNILWLCSDYELIKYNSKTKEVKSFDSKTGFINTRFTAIKEDNKGNLWLPTFAGLNKFNKTTEVNQIYFKEDGLSNNEFNNNSDFTLDDGRFVFGSISGFTIVDPSNTEVERINYPKIEVHRCRMLTSKNASRIDLTQQVNKERELTFTENSIESNIELSHHSYADLKFKKFKYRILSEDQAIKNDQWINLVSNEIQIGRMPYGEYTLQFQAFNRSGTNVSEINEIKLYYKKPFYKTLLFILLGILLTLLSIYYFFQKRSQALIQQKLALETEVELRTQQIRKQKQEFENLNSTKDKLFSILAHDLKSPLITLKNISGKINYLIKKEQPDRILEIGKTIEDKVSKLNIFLDNLLNWALQQRGHLSYNPKELFIQEITDEVLSLYEDDIQEKNLLIEEEFFADSSCYADENSIKTVIRNIIHNAIKYSPSNTKISLRFRKDENFNVLAISDMGAGISKDIIEAVYKKEHINNTPGTGGEKGTGLGFLISKELLDLNNGQIVFISNKKKGTTVELLFPNSPPNQAV